MLSREENAILTQTNSGTPMGEYFRRYWSPALLASELPGPDCPPSVDGTRERLGTSDAGIIAMRRLLLQEVRKLQQGEPFAAHHGDIYWVRSASSVLKRDVDFEDGCRSLMKAEV